MSALRYASQEVSTEGLEDPDSAAWGLGCDDLVCFCRDYGLTASRDRVIENWVRVSPAGAPGVSPAGGSSFLSYDEFLRFVQIGAKDAVSQCHASLSAIPPRLRELLQILRGVDDNGPSVLVMSRNTQFWSDRARAEGSSTEHKKHAPSRSGSVHSERTSSRSSSMRSERRPSRWRTPSPPRACMTARKSPSMA